MPATRKYSGPERRRFAREALRDRPVGARADNVVKLGGVEIAKGGEEYVRGKELRRTPDRDGRSANHIDRPDKDRAAA